MYLFSGDDSLFVGVWACVCEFLFEVSQLFRLSCCLTVRCVCLRPQVSPLRLKRQIGRQRACRIPGTIAFCLSLFLTLCRCSLYLFSRYCISLSALSHAYTKKTHTRSVPKPKRAVSLHNILMHWHAHNMMAVPKGEHVNYSTS